ncbi:MAG: alanine racemase [Candidatus Zixiibacteriota bacterium]|nr:MAG: alanine racemase [candidate division Zixibacteria bacterium]
MRHTPLTWIEIDVAALGHNLATIRKLAGNRLIAAAVKANAYGHGLREIVTLLLKERVDYLAVNSVEEARMARACGWTKNLLCVGYIPLGDLDAVFEANIEPTVYNRETISRLGWLASKYQKAASIHLKIETGTNRQGIEPGKIERILAAAKKYPFLHLKGLSTHFANIEDTTDHSYASFQLRQFKAAVRQIRRLGFKPDYRHTACSAALLLFEETKFELVRPGIALYGLWPSKETYLSYRLRGGSNDILTPILKWKTRVIQIKEVPPDAFIGYGCTYRTTSKTKLAVLPVGYYDGYDRSLSNLAHVIINGKRAPLRGRVCMNLIMVDITDIKGVKLEDSVTLLGRDGAEQISADQMATWAGTVNYEIISRLSTQIPRFVV